MRSVLPLLVVLAGCKSPPDAPSPTAALAESVSPAPVALAPDAGLGRAEVLARLTAWCEPGGHISACAAQRDILALEGAREAVIDIESDWITRCGAGELEACYRAGAIAHDIELVRRACDKGQAASCFTVGIEDFDPAVVMAPGPEQRRRYAQVAKRMTAACDGGFGRGCQELAWMYFEGTGVIRDRKRAVAMAQGRCAGGDAESCRDAAELQCKLAGRSGCDAAAK